MISETHFSVLEKANQRLARNWRTLKDARAEGNAQRIKRAELNYLQALQRVFNAAETAVAPKSMKPKSSS